MYLKIVKYRLEDWKQMESMGLNALGLYTYPTKAWRDSDNIFIKKHILPNTSNVNIILSDMGRLNDMLPINANCEIDPNVLLFHHYLSKWPKDLKADHPWNKQADSIAVNWLIDEIKHNCANGQFSHIMAYSWLYGPKRIKIIMDSLKKDGYEFLTLGQFTKLYHEAILLNHSVSNISR
ncbi:MAG: hypothetical protein QM610_15250 [Chitinophagaceae bacterium]